MVLTDPDAAIVDAHERIDALEESVTTKHEGLLQRIEALERFDGHIAEAMGRDGVAGRLEALEERLETHAAVFRADGITADGFDKRIRELEEHRVFAVDREYDRVARWHATYNAALQANAVSGVEARHINAVHESCEAAADRAHGPLEIVVPAGTTFDEAALAKGGKLVSQPGWSQWDARVEALVKAATRFLASHNAHNLRKNPDHDAGCGCCECEMVDSLKPFEASRGGE